MGAECRASGVAAMARNEVRFASHYGPISNSKRSAETDRPLPPRAPQGGRDLSNLSGHKAPNRNVGPFGTRDGTHKPRKKAACSICSKSSVQINVYIQIGMDAYLYICAPPPHVWG